VTSRGNARADIFEDDNDRHLFLSLLGQTCPLCCAGFGPSGEGFFRLSAFAHRENVIEVVERIKKNLK